MYTVLQFPYFLLNSKQVTFTTVLPLLYLLPLVWLHIMFKKKKSQNKIS